MWQEDREAALTGQETPLCLLLVELYDVYRYYGMVCNNWYRVYEAFFPFYETAITELVPDFETLAHSLVDASDYQECCTQLYRELYDLVCEYEGRAPDYIEPP